MRSEKTSEGFYDSIADEYTAAIRRCVPRYQEMLAMLLAYLPPEFSPTAILELGCGSGNLTLGVVERFPSAFLAAVDRSARILEVFRSRVPHPRVKGIQSDFRQVGFRKASFDLIVSSISIHHLQDDDKQDLFRRIHHWLSPPGIFVFSDQFRGEIEHLYQTHLQRWEREVRERGMEEAEWNQWMEHQREHDYHAPLRRHLEWLRQAGFRVADCPWRYLLWAVVYAQKGGWGPHG